MLPRRPEEKHGWGFIVTFGGGLVAGDAIGLSVDVGEGSTLVLLTQASTKIYKSINNREVHQHLSCKVDPKALLVILPDPITCFENACYNQSQTFCVHTTGNLILLDWLTCGRAATGEIWVFQKYHSTNSIYLYDKDMNDKQILFHDNVFLKQEENFSIHTRMGQITCIGSVVLFGPKLNELIKQIKVKVSFLHEQQQRTGERSLFCSVSPFLNQPYPMTPLGLVIRFASSNTEPVRLFLEQILDLVNLLEQNPWKYKEYL